MPNQAVTIVAVIIFILTMICYLVKHFINSKVHNNTRAQQIRTFQGSARLGLRPFNYSHPFKVDIVKNSAGFVIAAGGPIYTPLAYALTSQLTLMHPRAKIEVWYVGDAEISHTDRHRWKRAIPSVTFHDVISFVSKDSSFSQFHTQQWSSLCGWHTKIFAAAFTTLQHCIVLDADVVITSDCFSVIWKSLQERQFEMMLLSDIPTYKTGSRLFPPWAWKEFGITQQRTPNVHARQVDSSCVVLDRGRSSVQGAVQFMLETAKQHTSLYKVVYGDKDVWRVAAIREGVDVYTPNVGCGSLFSKHTGKCVFSETAMVHLDPTHGNRIWYIQGLKHAVPAHALLAPMVFSNGVYWDWEVGTYRDPRSPKLVSYTFPHTSSSAHMLMSAKSHTPSFELMNRAHTRVTHAFKHHTTRLHQWRDFNSCCT